MDALITNAWIIRKALDQSDENRNLCNLLLNKIEHDDIPEDVQAEAVKGIHAMIDALCSVCDNAEIVLSLIAQHMQDEQQFPQAPLEAIEFSIPNAKKTRKKPINEDAEVTIENSGTIF